jgi:hypothetical protein
MVKFVVDTNEKSLVMEGNKLSDSIKWTIQAYCDSDYTGDRDTRISITGFIIYICGIPILWRSKVQRSVTLSPSEAEYVVISEVCAEVMFVKQILEFLKVKVELQIQVMVDNVGAIYLTDNQSVSQRTRHIYIRYHFVREYVEDGIVKINFVQSEENDADIFTKNLGSELFKKHASKFIKERQ